MDRALPFWLALPALLGGCIPDRSPPASAASKPAPPAPAVLRSPGRRTPPAPRVLTGPGLEGVIGADAEDLFDQFGPARLDLREGDARKLQFAGEPCVLDVYLYPDAPGREPRATYVDARRASDGQDVDRAACVRALRGR